LRLHDLLFLSDTNEICHVFYVDSGLSLTTARDITEFESDHESKENAAHILRNSKLNRSMPIKRNTNETDSDDVFAEVRQTIVTIVLTCSRTSMFE
jgi:hypothetical protein